LPIMQWPRRSAGPSAPRKSPQSGLYRENCIFLHGARYSRKFRR
jgi:hypothetical protein